MVYKHARNGSSDRGERLPGASTDSTNMNCPNCGRTIPSDARFCGYCGTRLSTSVDVQHPSPLSESGISSGSTYRIQQTIPPFGNTIGETIELQNERREVTVLVADISNFTAASHRIDHEDIYILTNEAMRSMVEIIFRYEGSVEHFTGDGLIALFGAPVGHENDPERAVRAALEIQRALELLRLRAVQRYNFDLRVRIGIHTGWVIMGKVGNELHTEYTVVGDTIQLASYLESQAEPGTVLVSFATYQRTRPIFHYHRIALKQPQASSKNGRPVMAFRPLCVRERPGNVRGLPGMQIPLIGREEELQRLKVGFQKMLSTGHTTTIAVIGEAGLGKSRLVSEFTYWVEKHGVPVYEAACLAYGRSSPYWMVAELLRGLSGISEGLTGDAQIRELRRWLQGLPLDLDTELVLPYLLIVLGLDTYVPDLCRSLNLLEQGMLQQRIHVMLRHVLWATLRESSVLVLEDLHWIDAPSREFLENFLQMAENLPVFIVLISRDYEPHTQIGRLLASANQMPGHLEPIQLRALSYEQCRFFLDQLIPGESPRIREVKETIVRRAEGNPFYIEEMVRMLIDEGGIVVHADGLDVTDEAVALMDEIPGTLAGLILARFDRLPPPLRRTLQQAAVLGRAFPLSLMQALRPSEPEIVQGQLDSLVERHFLQHESFGHELGYAFRHSLIQDVIYHTLLRKDQQRLHSLVAQIAGTKSEIKNLESR